MDSIIYKQIISFKNGMVAVAVTVSYSKSRTRWFRVNLHFGTHARNRCVWERDRDTETQRDRDRYLNLKAKQM